MSDLRRCPRCDSDLPADAPQGLCPRCLLQAGFESRLPGAPTASVSTQGFTPPTPAELATLLPQLEILEFLGKGGMGAVYKARQPGLDRLVAVKILPPEVGADPAFAERFAREARSLARLSHPHIVTVYDFGQTASLFYFVMEYVDGVNLRQALRAGDLKSAEALKIVPQICDALQFAHDEGIVHRDIKPENILLDRKGRIKIADFGLAKLMGIEAGSVTLTGTQQTMGTLHYMAPEQLEGTHTVDHRADIYSLGVTFYEMLTGELPIGRFAPPSHKVQIDVRLDEVVLRTLEKEPGRRFQHVGDVKTEVEAIVRSKTPPSVPTADAVEKTILEYLPGRKIEAIRVYRDLTGGSLLDAVRAVDAIIAKHGIIMPPASLGETLYGWGILASMAAVVIVGSVISIKYLDISPLLTTPIIFLCLVVPQAVKAVRHWGTSKGKRAALLTGVWTFLLFGGPVLLFLAQPEETLEWLANLTGSRVGRHDADFIRGLFLFLIALSLFLLIRYWIQLRREARAQTPTKATAVSSPLDPENLKKGVKVLLWLTLIVAGATALFVTLEAREEGEGKRLLVNVGAFEPWLTFERLELTAGGFESTRHLHWQHFSFWAAVVALASWYGLFRLRDKDWTWSGWWLQCPVPVRRTIQAALTVVCLVGVIWFLSFEARASQGAKEKQSQVFVGAFDPWFYHKETANGFTTSVRLFSLAALMGYASFYSLWLLIAAERAEKARQPGQSLFNR